MTKNPKKDQNDPKRPKIIENYLNDQKRFKKDQNDRK